MTWFVLFCTAGALLGYQALVEFVARREEAWHGKQSPVESGIREATGGVTSRRGTNGLERLEHPNATSTATISNSELLKSNETSSDHSWKGWRTVVVKSIRDESPDCRSFTLASLNSEPLADFVGGQSILVGLRDPQTGKRVSRCYSLSSGPEESCYRITVKRVPGGVLSNLLHDTVRAGDEIEIQAPRGRFHFDPSRDNEPLTLIAAGIGITPMLSMLLQSLGRDSKRQINLIYQLRDAGNAPFLESLRELADSPLIQDRARLKVWFSRPRDEDAWIEGDAAGRVDANQILELVPNAAGEFLLCGPDQFMSSIAEGLVAGGASEQLVKYESFGGKASGVGAIAVGTDSANEATNDGADQNQYDVSFVGGSETQSATWDPGTESLLELAEEADVEVDSSCRSGHCGACVRRLIKGSVTTTIDPECDLEPDEIVLCISKPCGDVEIEV